MLRLIPCPGNFQIASLNSVYLGSARLLSLQLTATAYSWRQRRCATTCQTLKDKWSECMSTACVHMYSCVTVLTNELQNPFLSTAPGLLGYPLPSPLACHCMQKHNPNLNGPHGVTYFCSELAAPYPPQAYLSPVSGLYMA